MRRVALIVLAVTVLRVTPALAQDEPEPWDRDTEQLREQGWEFADEDLVPGSPAGGSIALTLGFLIHGLGHLYIGDVGNALKLLGLEGISLVAAIGGATMQNSFDEDTPGYQSAAILTQGAASLFFASWLADVVGSYKGRNVPLPRNTADPEGASAEIYYTSIFADGLGFNSVVVARFPVSLRQFSLRPELHIAPELAYRLAGVEAGARFPLFRRFETFLELSGLASDEAMLIGDSRYGRTSFGGMARLSFDLGDFIPHLANVVWKNGIGVSADFFFFGSDEVRRLQSDQMRLQIPVEASLGLNLSRGVNLTVGLRHRDDLIVGTGPGGASFYEELSFVPRNRIGFEIRVEHGLFVRLWAGIRWQFSDGRSGVLAE